MKKNVFRIPEALSLITVAVFIVGRMMQAQKANMDMAPIERFDFIMRIYKIGNALITVSVCFAAAAVVSWIIAAAINLKNR